MALWIPFLGLDCKKCSEGQKAFNGCEKNSQIPDRWEVGEYKLNRCPLKELTPEGLEYLEAYKFYKNGILPMPGGWLNQTNTLIDAIKIIDREIENISKERAKEK